MKRLKYIVFIFVYFSVEISPRFAFSPIEFKVFLSGVSSAQAQEGVSKRRRSRRLSPSFRQFAVALNLAKQARYEEASQRLFDLRTNPRFRNRRGQIYYILGLMLFKLNLYQVSAFQFSEVISRQDRKYLQPSIEKLVLLTSEILSSSAVLNYSLGTVNLGSFPRTHRDRLHLRIGEVQVNNKQFTEAIKALSKIDQGSDVYPRAKYLEGLAYAENKQPQQALRAFANLVESRSQFPINDSLRTSGLMGMARSAYQLKDWDRAIELYRSIPRDTSQWFDSLFEMTWAQIRAAQLRFALGNFQSLHSPYYETNYHPESLILRAILYLHICQYDEMEKTLNFFKKVYFPIRSQLRKYMGVSRSPRSIYKDFEVLYQNQNQSLYQNEDKVPYVVAKNIFREGDVRNGLSYITQVQDELKKVQSMSDTWQNAKIGRYAKRLLTKRIHNAQLTVGRDIFTHLRRIRRDLAQLIRQHGLAQYEMLNAKRDMLKRRIIQRNLKKQSEQSKRSRNFYVQSGYEYWPFQGEYWLDELGNYYYLGVNGCKN